MAVQGTLIHQVAHLVDKGFSPESGALILGFTGILGSFGKILFGYLSDKIGRAKAFSIGLGCAFFGVLDLMLIQQYTVWLLYGYALFFGLGYGAFAPIFAAHAADLFHGIHFGKIYGSLSIAGGIGGAIGAWVNGKIFDLTSSYQIAFVLVLSSIALAAISFCLSSIEGRCEQ